MVFIMRFFIILGLFVTSTSFLAAENFCCESEQQCDEGVSGSGDSCETIDGEGDFPEEEN